MIVVFLAGVLIAGLWMTGRADRGDRLMGVNVLIKDGISQQILTDLKRFGRVKDVIDQIHAVTMLVRPDALSAIRALPYVESANPDQERAGIPIDTVAAEDFSAGWSTWNLDAINVTDFGYDNRQVDQDGTGVYVAVLDTGLIDTWRQYFPQERIAAEYARSFGGGGHCCASGIDMHCTLEEAIGRVLARACETL